MKVSDVCWDIALAFRSQWTVWALKHWFLSTFKTNMVQQSPLPSIHFTTSFTRENTRAFWRRELMYASSSWTKIRRGLIRWWPGHHHAMIQWLEQTFQMSFNAWCISDIVREIFQNIHSCFHTCFQQSARKSRLAVLVTVQIEPRMKHVFRGSFWHP